MTKELDTDVRNEYLAAGAGLHAEHHDLCDITVWCDSATSRVTRFTLLINHRVRRKAKTMGRVACPACKTRGAWWQAAAGDEEETGSGLARQLNPFRRDPAEEMPEMTLECVVCRAYLVQEHDENGDAADATTIVDGMALCDDHARSMIGVIAAKLPKRETT